MMNYIWAFMLCFGIFFAFLDGSLPEFTDNLLASCNRAVQFIISLAGIMAVWTGIMKIAEESELIEMVARRFKPVVSYLFPREKDEETISLILMSFMANIFGAGNSATVFSLKAMERLDHQNPHKEEASDEMCMFVALSMSMVQLVPFTVIQIRTNLGSTNSASIILPSIAVGFLSMFASVFVCKLCQNKRRSR